MTVTANDTRVVNFFNDINGSAVDSDGYYIGSSKSKTGYLYVTGDNQVQVCLPLSLVEYANASSGNMPGGRPVGIRAGKFNTAEQAAQAVAKIFSSPVELAKFINSSECDAGPYDPSINTPRAGVGHIVQIPAREGFYEKYNAAVAKGISAKFGREGLITYFNENNGFTLNDVELVYGTAANNFDLNVYA